MILCRHCKKEIELADFINGEQDWIHTYSGLGRCNLFAKPLEEKQ